MTPRGRARRSGAAALAAAMVLSGCAAVPGYSPPTKKSEKKQPPPVVGSFDRRGTYVPTQDERNLKCRTLSGRIHLGILQLRAARLDTASPIKAATQRTLAKPMAGSEPRTSEKDETAHAEARLRALNGLLIDKHCPAYDLDAELRSGATGDPQPVGRGQRAR